MSDRATVCLHELRTFGSYQAMQMSSRSVTETRLSHGLGFMRTSNNDYLNNESNTAPTMRNETGVDRAQPSSLGAATLSKPMSGNFSSPRES